MIIRNVRLGFAANSSSTHSIVLMPEGARLPGDNGVGPFGWEFFTAASKEAKERYANVLLRSAIHDAVPESLQRHVAAALNVPLEPPSEKVTSSLDIPGVPLPDITYDMDDYIDHQSVLLTPLDKDYGPHFGFLQDLRDYLVNTKRVVILGGNDNEDADHPVLERPGVKEVLGDYPREYGRYRCRQESPKVWTLFNTENGARMTVDFNEPDPMAVKEMKLRTPLLVDLKITDKCTYGCQYCYQDSTKDGKECTNLHQIISILEAWEVFEVALGGGEPTTHKDFLFTLQCIKKGGMVPNFTTRNLQWLKDPNNARKVADLCGTFAFSVDNADQVTNLQRALIVHEENGINLKPQVQVVVGAVSDYYLEEILRRARGANLNVTLLGYKTVGRGGKFDPKPVTPKGLVKILVNLSEKCCLPHVGIDTALAKVLEPILKTSGIPEYAYHVIEGRSSMYWDGVTNRIGPSSYCDEKQYVKLDARFDEKTALEAFQSL